MFKKLKDKIAEEVKSSPSRIQQLAQVAQVISENSYIEILYAHFGHAKRGINVPHISMYACVHDPHPRE